MWDTSRAPPSPLVPQRAQAAARATPSAGNPPRRGLAVASEMAAHARRMSRREAAATAWERHGRIVRERGTEG